MATHSGILAWTISWTRVVWWAILHEDTMNQTQMNDETTTNARAACDLNFS